MARVLVVDDDDDIRMLIALTLERAGYSVTSVADGNDALAELVAEHYDLTVLDVCLPGLDGIEVARALRSAKPETSPTVVMVSAMTSAADRAAGRAAGAVTYMTKPFRLGDLADTVASHVPPV
ncbi:response regulator [Nocardioides acrostichi]|uniref:Response regulator n=1 Tax=Nocardioides acrostichi TaxID=2784339 RepID=A0A930YD54_9ACTN|nr:response regulator [Nocardioides acrostichi]MBF4162129.1 response regulator [Nocardioides acrostichi]